MHRKADLSSSAHSNARICNRRYKRDADTSRDGLSPIPNCQQAGPLSFAHSSVWVGEPPQGWPLGRERQPTGRPFVWLP